MRVCRLLKSRYGDCRTGQINCSARCLVRRGEDRRRVCCVAPPPSRGRVPSDQQSRRRHDGQSRSRRGKRAPGACRHRARSCVDMPRCWMDHRRPFSQTMPIGARQARDRQLRRSASQRVIADAHVLAAINLQGDVGSGAACPSHTCINRFHGGSGMRILSAVACVLGTAILAHRSASRRRPSITT